MRRAPSIRVTALVGVTSRATAMAADAEMTQVRAMDVVGAREGRTIDVVAEMTRVRDMDEGAETTAE